MSSPIIDRIIEKSDRPDLLEWLTEQLSGADFQSLLLEIIHRRSQKFKPTEILQAYRQNRFVKPSSLAPELFLELDQLALRLRGHFEFIELSPLAPMGSCSALATVHQNKVVSALRNTEAVSDPTNLMALEIASRRKAARRETDKSSPPVHLMSSQRVTRAQYFENPKFSAHFRLLSLCSGGRDRGNYLFEMENLTEHLRFYLQFLSNSKQLGYRPKGILVLFSDFTPGIFQSIITQQVIAPLKKEFSEAAFDFATKSKSGRGYYQNFRFNILLRTPDGELLPLIDGGDTDWTQRLLSDRKERLLTSAIGTQLYAQIFKNTD